MTTTSTQVADAYQAILLNAPPGGANGAYAISVAAQINASYLNLGNFESSLIGLDQTMYSTLPALVTIDAFYGATPSLNTLTTAATATSGTTYYTAQELHNLGYSDANVWTIMGSEWGADQNSQFYQLYSGLATGNTSDYQTFINEVYQREFGTLPTQANLQNLLNDIPGVQQLLNGGGQTASAIQVMGGLFGYLLYAGQSNNIGTYTTPAVNFLTTAATDEANNPGSSASLYGGQDFLQIPGIGTGTNPTQTYLTTAADNVTANNIYGSLTPYNINGVGPTLQSTDVINGSPGSTNNTLTISDDYAANNDAIPVGTTINNVQDVVLNTQGNAGGNAVFDTTPYGSVNSVTVNSSGWGQDNVQVSGSTALTVTHSNVNGGKNPGTGQVNGVQTYGGSTVTVTNNGAKSSLTTIGSTTVANANPTGDVTVNAVDSTTLVFGGANVTVNQTGATGAVTIGVAGYSVSPAEPTGTVTVNAPATTTGSAGTAITVFGGIDTNLTSGGGVITVGSHAVGSQTVYAPTGNDTIVDNAAVASTSDYVSGATNGFTLPAPAVTLVGGQNVNITTNAGAVTVGDTAAQGHAFNGSNLIPGVLPTGDVTIVDTADLGGAAGATPVAVYGGADVSVSDSGSAVTIGNSSGSNVVAPTGSVTVSDTAQVGFDNVINRDNHAVTTLGGTDVTISTNAGAVAVGTAAGTAGTEPSGNVQVTQSAIANVAIDGGANVMVSGAGGVKKAGNGEINIGSGTTASNPTGDVTVTQSGVMTGENGITDSAVTIGGGANISVTETGGSVTAGSYGSPVTGAVSITDTQSGPNSDAFTVVGGTTTQINTTATSGAITVGSNNASLDSTGTALKTPTAYATGNVTVVNETVPGSNGAGSTPVYGAGTDAVYTNGASSVSLTGGSNAIITDMQTTKATGGSNAGKAIGTSTLATVSLDGVAGASTITSDALTALSMADTTGGVTVNETPAHSLNLTLSNDSKGSSVADATATAVAIADTGTAANEVALNAAKATSLTINNAAALTLDPSVLGSLASITATGSGSLNLGDLTGDGGLKSINASGSNGAVTVALDETKTSFQGGTGSDTVTINGNPGTTGGTNKIIAGTAANNTLIANYAAAGTDASLGASTLFRGFTTLGLGTLANGTYDASGFSALTVGQVAGPVTLSNVAPGTSLTITAAPTQKVDYILKDAKGTNDSLQLNVGVDGTSKGIGTSGAPAYVQLDDGVVGNGIVNLNISSVGASGSQNFVRVDDDNLANTADATKGNAVKQITVTGDSALTLTYNALSGTSNVSSINASGSSAKVDVTGVAVSNGGVSVTGGSGQLLAQGSASTTAADSYVTGSGGGTLTLGSGGAWNAGKYDSGSETVNLTASSAVSDTLVVNNGVTSTNNGSKGGVTGFVSAAGSAADVIDLTGKPGPTRAFNVLANQSTATNVQTYGDTATNGAADLGVLDPANTLANLAYTSSNGVITFSATGIHSLSEFTQAQLIVAAEAIVTAAADASKAEQVAMFTTQGSTFVVASDVGGTGTSGNHLYGAEVIELNNVTGLTGFGTTGAASVVDTQNVKQVSALHAGTNTGSTYNDAGFSEDSLTAGAAGVTNTYNNLGAAAILDAIGAGDQGNVVVTQIGTSGSDSLAVNLATTALDSLTVNGDATLLFQVSNGKTALVTSLVDASNTLTSISIGSAANPGTGSSLTIGGITDTALTSINASNFQGSLTVTDNQSGLAITGALGGDAITANGANDKINVGSSTGAALTGPVQITANGSGDTMVLSNEAAAGINKIVAASSGDVITVDSGNNVIGGTVTGSTPLSALGAGDTVNLLSGSSLPAAAATNDKVWIGDNGTVNLGSSSNAFGSGATHDQATIQVTGDLAQAGSSGGYHQTTITGADGLGANAMVNIDMLNLDAAGNNLTFAGWAGTTAANAEVNVASATSLGQALDTAASQALTIDGLVNGNAHVTPLGGQLDLNAGMGLADWFQWGGNTYIVESINPTTSASAHTGLAASDSVVQLTGLVNIGTAAHLTVGFA